MFGIDQVVDKVGSLFGSGAGVSDALQGGIGDLLNNANLDPALLEGLQLDQIGEALASAGIDPASLGEGQFGEIIQHWSDSGSLEGLDLSGVLADKGGG